MKPENIYVGIDVAKAQVDVVIRPGGETWSADYDERGIGELDPIHRPLDEFNRSC